jgi:nuclease-like protein
MTNRVISLLCFSIIFLSLLPVITYSHSVDARCPNGYHKSPSGDCEKVTHSGGLPRCPNGYHRSPDGDCERVSSGSSSSKGSESEDDENDDENERIDETSSSDSETPISQSTECKGTADCFRGIVTEIVDGDTLDVNNVRIRLSMVNTPERGDLGYEEAIDTTESECSLGSQALVDEDDGQRGGSFDRLIGVVYCNASSTSLNQALMEEGKAVLYEDFCDVSEFAGDEWVTKYGC